jgi:hypothetical protein
VPWPFKWGKGQRTSSPNPVVSEEQIRARAHFLSKIAPWRTATENWEQAERELSLPEPSRSRVAFWRWCGFSEKKGWDWLDFLVRLSVPLVIAGGGLIFTHWSGVRQQQISGQEREDAVLRASEERKDLVLREYLKEMKTILLDSRTAIEARKPGSSAYLIARAFTLTTLAQLQGSGPLAPQRRSLVFQFLREAKAPILVGADFAGYDLSGTNLIEANLSGANLMKTNLSGANLYKSNLSGAILIRANLSRTHLGKANLSRAILANANLNEANLFMANLSGASLLGVNLSETTLIGAKFEHTICPDGTKTDTGC